MNRLTQTLHGIATALDELEIDWALVGGLAVSARAEPRTTRDVDIAVAVDSDAAAEALVHGLQARGYSVVGTVEQTRTGRLATARLALAAPGSVQVVVDLLFASSGIEREVVAAATRLDLVPGLTVPIASLGHLLVLKVLARDDRHRPQDWDDIRALVAEANDVDLEQARAAAELVAQRGYDRGRDLPRALEEALAELAADQ